VDILKTSQLTGLWVSAVLLLQYTGTVYSYRITTGTCDKYASITVP